ncbi:MAG: DUF1343 domain-containing protein [Bacteroidota bacterium]
MTKNLKVFFIIISIILIQFVSFSSFATNRIVHIPNFKVGAERLDIYLSQLKGKRVALLINQTSVVYNKLLLDTLISRGVNVVKIFVPEHGFRGTADAGAHIKNEIDTKTGLPVISLYGKNKKPSVEQMKDIDILVYDLQDVGVRFYTYISTLEYAMDACIESSKELLILDRPNPNRHVIDGPVLDTNLKSFVGMQPVPVVYGMTVGEYAQMIVGECWIKNAKALQFKVIACQDYSGDLREDYKLPVSPSPNLKNMTAIYYYPSLCFFEGTIVSVGRGTERPFQQWGHPDYKGKFHYSFMPKSTVGATQPLLENQECFGDNLLNDSYEARKQLDRKLNLSYLLRAYQFSPQKDKFFNPFFEKLAGTKLLRQQIIEGKSEAEIRSSWQPELDKFKAIRKKYLLYED